MALQSGICSARAGSFAMIGNSPIEQPRPRIDSPCSSARVRCLSVHTQYQAKPMPAAKPIAHKPSMDRLLCQASSSGLPTSRNHQTKSTDHQKAKTVNAARRRC